MSRLYYTDSECRGFDAIVTRSVLHEGRPAVVLDRTAFYPTSGGQPYDTGALGDTRVIDVVDVGGEVIHVVSVPLAEGTRVHGDIDWTRRFDHMQQHTGQHVLSAAFERLTGNPTLSFHMGADVSTIDVGREVSPEAAARAEDEANRVVWEDRPVSIRFVSSDEAARLPLRKEPSREGPLRLIDVSEFDLSACGGTHVARTGAIGLIALLGWERFKGGSRVSFVCGGRALRSHRSLRDAVAGSVRALSVLPAELPDAIERLQAEAQDQRKAIKGFQDLLSAHQAERLLADATLIAGVRVVVRALEGWDAAGLKAMATALAAAGGAAAVLLTASLPAQAVVARSTDVQIDARAILRQLVDRFGGKGGGKPDLAQGGGLTGDLRQMVWEASGLVEEAIQPRNHEDREGHES